MNTKLSISEELFLSGALALVLIFISQVLTWVVSRQQSLEQQRFWRLTFRNLAALAFFIGMAGIWYSQLRTVVMALGAATVGVLLTFREAWLSLMGFWIRVVKRQFSLGDFVEIDGIRGRVLDITWQHTALAETGPGRESFSYSGRVVHIPNSKILLAPVFVDNLTGEYGAHTIQIPLHKDVDALKAEESLYSIAQAHCSEFFTVAEEHMATIRKTYALDTPSVEPKTQLRFDNDGDVVLMVRIVVPFLEKVRVEQRIIKDFLRAKSNMPRCPDEVVKQA